MTVLAQALVTVGPQARELFVLSQLDQLVGQVAAKVSGLSVREIHVIDSGDGAPCRRSRRAIPPS